MNSDVLNSALAIGGFLLGLGTTIAAYLAWMKQSATKAYAAQRDFQHLMRSYEQLAAGQATLLRELDERADRLQNALDRQQILLQAVLAKSGSDESIGAIMNKLGQMQ